MKLFYLLFIFVFLDANEYTLNQLIQLSIKNSKTIKLSNLQINKLNQNIKYVSNLKLPKLDIELNAVRLDEKPIFDFEIGGREYQLENSGRDVFKGDINLIFPIFNKINLLKEKSNLALGIEKVKQKITENEIKIFVKQNYNTYLYLDKSLKELNKFFDNYKILFNLTEKFYKNSFKINKIDYLKAKMLYFHIKDMILSLTKYRDITLKNLNYFIKDKSLKIIGQFQQLLLKNGTYNNNLQFQIYNKLLQINDISIEEAKYNFYPKINGYLNYHILGSDKKIGIINDVNNMGWIIGINFKLNFNLENLNLINIKQIEKQQNLIKKNILDDKLNLQQHILLDNLNNLNKKINNLKNLLDTAKEHKILIEKSYKYEMVKTRDMLEAEMFYINYKLEYYKSIYKYNTDLISLEKVNNQL